MQRLRNVRLSGIGSSEWIVITDSITALQTAKAARRAVIGIIDNQDENQNLDGADYLAEQIEDIDDAFAERVLRRHLGLPWVIADLDSLILRELTIEDIPNLYLLYGKEDAFTGETLSEDLFMEQEKFGAYQKAMYEFCEYGLWAVIHKKSGKLIGRVGFSQLEQDHHKVSIELSYQIRPEYRGRGYGEKAARAALLYGWEELEFGEVYLRCDLRNKPSLGLASKLGFCLERETEENQGLFYITI